MPLINSCLSLIYYTSTCNFSKNILLPIFMFIMMGSSKKSVGPALGLMVLFQAMTVKYTIVSKAPGKQLNYYPKYVGLSLFGHNHFYGSSLERTCRAGHTSINHNKQSKFTRDMSSSGLVL